LWINITNKEDDATGTIFPIGATIGKALFAGWALTDGLLTSSWSTIGHFPNYQTHSLSLHYHKVPPCNFKPRSAAPVTGYPRIVDGRKSYWYSFESGSGENHRALFFDQGTDCDAAFYSTRFKELKLKPARGSMWNIISNRELLDCGVNAERRTESCPHNAFVQTSLNRMLIELQLARAKQ
jgi:hypothetical protein